MYVQRSLDGYPHSTPLLGLSVGMGAVVRALPMGRPLILLYAERLSQRIQQLTTSASEKAAPAEAASLIAPALDLAKLLAHLITVVDLQV